MRLVDLDYDLPDELIAQVPLADRSASRLLVDQGGAAPPIDSHVRDLGSFLEPGDLVVLNDSKVIPARLRLHRRSGAAVEVMLLEPAGPPRQWTALVRPGRKVKPGEALLGAGDVEVARMSGRAGDDVFVVELLGTDDELAMLDRHGEMPLPPYIRTPLGQPDRYQTVYAAAPGSAAAPTAGLHFTPQLLDGLRAGGVDIAAVELVVGLDTFRPITVDDPLHHAIHTERYRVAADVMDRCRSARRVVAVGTTAVRALESAATSGALDGRTSLFIHRGYTWKVVDLMLTNFHMPRTSLLLMIDAFVGPRWRSLYQHALDHGYRFLSFGDAMLLSRGR